MASLNKPVPGGDIGTWGTKINTALDALNTELIGTTSTANAAETPTGAQNKVNTLDNGLAARFEAKIDRTGRATNDIVSLAANGTLVLTTPATGQTIPVATTNTTGTVTLAGDLAGTAASPQIAAGVIVNADVNASAAISLDKTADSATRLAMTAAERTKLTGLSSSLTLNTQTASYTLALTDATDRIVQMNLTTANTLTIPTNASVAFPVGTVIGIAQINTGLTTVTPAGGVTLTWNNGTAGTGAKALGGQYADASLLKVATDTWRLVGGLAA